MSKCICPVDGVACLGEGYEGEPNTCNWCHDLDGEEHCPQCPCFDCIAWRAGQEVTDAD